MFFLIKAGDEMGTIKDKRKLKNWIDNDVFALPIKNCKYKELNGKFLILIKDTIWNLKRTEVIIRAKITNGELLPKNEQELEELEYIIIYTQRVEGLLKLTAKVEVKNAGIIEFNRKKIFHDKYGYINTYIMQLWARKGLPQNLIYLGNYNISKPKFEYIPETEYSGIVFRTIEDAEEVLTNNYYNYNLKKDFSYTKEGVEKRSKIACDNSRIEKENELLVEALNGPHKDEILNAMGIDTSKESRRSKLTYVGEGTDPAKKKKSKRGEA